MIVAKAIQFHLIVVAPDAKPHLLQMAILQQWYGMFRECRVDRGRSCVPRRCCWLIQTDVCTVTISITR